MAAHDFSVKRFGFATKLNENPVVAEIGVAAVTVLRGDPDRVFWLVVNLSVNIVYLAFDRAVGAARGIRLDPNGGWASMAVDEDGEAVAYELLGVASGANSAIYVLEIKKA